MNVQNLFIHQTSMRRTVHFYCRIPRVVRWEIVKKILECWAVIGVAFYLCDYVTAGLSISNQSSCELLSYSPWNTTVNCSPVQSKNPILNGIVLRLSDLKADHKYVGHHEKMSEYVHVLLQPQFNFAVEIDFVSSMKTHTHWTAVISQIVNMFLLFKELDSIYFRIGEPCPKRPYAIASFLFLSVGSLVMPEKISPDLSVLHMGIGVFFCHFWILLYTAFIL